MDKIKEITSLQNPLVKKIMVLKEKSRERKKSGLFVLEGKKELELALKGNYSIEKVFFYDGIMTQKEVVKMIETLEYNPDLFSVSKEVYRKVAYRESTEGILALAKSRSHTLDSLTFTNKTPLVLVAEAPEKPGNIGALLRTADAANLDAVIISNLLGDLYNPNIIRSSIGCVFTNTIALASTGDTLGFLKANNIDIYCAALSASEEYTNVNFKNASALVVGTEASGLTNAWLNHATQNIIIPMRGEIDSMNVSVSAAILIFEALRQRNLNT